MNIKILGTGCFNCKKLEANTRQAIEELGMESEIEKVTEIQDIMSYGIMSTPALMVDETALVAGIVPSVDELKEKLIKL
jgi:small redox-active disulfide protein 2